MDFYSLFLTKKGRISVKTFWQSIIIIIATQILITIILQISGLVAVTSAGALTTAFLVSIITIFLLFLWPTICVFTKRLHDRGKTGWWLLILLVPIIGQIWFLIEAGTKQGVAGRNRYGADPLPKRSPFD